MIFLKQDETIKEETAATVGMFDGVHLGHRALIAALFSMACGMKTLAFTFRLQDESQRLYTAAEEERLLAATGLDYAFMQPYTKEFMATTRDEFMQLLKKSYNVRRLAVGEDFRFGQGAMGDAEFLLKNAGKYGLQVQVVPPVLADGEKISSTRIRRLVADGEVAKAGELLGGYYFASGAALAGEQEEFPVRINTSKITPPDGVYATITEVQGKQYTSVTIVAVQPAAGQSKAADLETNIFGCNGAPYGQAVTVYFVHRLRAEKPFAGPAERSQQALQDAAAAREILQKLPKQNVYKLDGV